jgi:hypothetical protein
MHTITRTVAHDPDGVPHEIVGWTLVSALGIAFCLLAALRSGTALATALFLVVPLMIVALDRRARRARTA